MLIKNDIFFSERWPKWTSFKEKRCLSEKSRLFKWRPFSWKTPFLALNGIKRRLSNIIVDIELIPTYTGWLWQKQMSFEKTSIHTKVHPNGWLTHDTTTLKKDVFKEVVRFTIFEISPFSQKSSVQTTFKKADYF
jgi:hypothetical protein